MNKPLDPVEAERRRRLRNKNLTVLAILLGFVVLVYAISIIKMTINSP